MAVKTITWTGHSVRIIDQRRLPGRLVYIHCRDMATLWRAIKNLSVRGAPALGAAAAFGVLLSSHKSVARDRGTFTKDIEKACRYLATARPTAVNLFHALKRMSRVLSRYPHAEVEELKKFIKKEALAVYEEDRKTCRAIGRNGAALIKKGSRILTVCNAGALATVDFGTALGVFYSAKRQKKTFRVYACESRPLLQGARLTVWELMREHIPTTLICDNMAAALMRQEKIDMVITGADRIAANGDTANKIGTYNLAVLARYHGIPFYVAAPFSTFDLKIKTGKAIPIEQRSKEEVIRFAGRTTTVPGVDVCNPAFDVTNARLITGFITEKAIIRPPFRSHIRKAVQP